MTETITMDNLSIYILFMLHKHGESYGYQINKSIIDNGIKVTHQCVYKALRKLLDKKLVTTTKEMQSNKPDRVHYKINKAGKDLLQRVTPQLRSEAINYFELALMTKSLAFVLFSMKIDEEILASLKAKRISMGENVSDIINYKIGKCQMQIDVMKSCLTTE